MTIFQPGQRIALVHTGDLHTRLQPGDTGTVQRHDRQQQIVYVRWDTGSALAMCLDAGDRIRPVAAPERISRDLFHLHPDRVGIGSAGVFAGDWAWRHGPDGDRIEVGFAGTLIDRWNGWAVFSCTRQVAEAIVGDQQHQRRALRASLHAAGVPDAELDKEVNTQLAELRFDGDVLIADQRASADDPDAIARFSPDVDGRYIVMGWNWCWQAVDPERCDRIIGDLPQPGDEQQFLLLRHTPGMQVPHTRLRLTGLQPRPTRCEIVPAAFTAVLNLDDQPVAKLTGHDDGTVTLQPPGTLSGALQSYAARCRHLGHAVTEARLLRALADEILLDEATRFADAHKDTLLRLIDDTSRTRTVTILDSIPHDLDERLAVGRTLTNRPRQSWQIWTGRDWFSVPATGTAAHQASTS
ncbi:DUF4314 domain-containing protein [Actinoplanes sp. Pm04-4]|uniref:DUF4314 domain-containing protein n=1 Tax=Paractinoplanes pyxinae TaxID=2997416 RepID=A0ABT4B7F9_9ACTN|nr:DUF4314 domain-containing protein [Actinoplanes pyxinae]MCY1141525.1 DUF4314 domain-containing protein [Actinoplanes pyxinae]